MTPDQLTKQRAAAPQAEHLDPQDIVRIVNSHGGGRSTLMAVLGDVQAKYRYLPQEALRIVAEQMGVPLVDVYAVGTFYHSFSLKPKGRHVVQCCLGTACHVRGGSGIAEELERQLGIGAGETTADMEFSLETVNCLGACALGPVVVVDGRYIPKVRKSQVRQILDSAREGTDEIDPARDKRVIPLEIDCPRCKQSLMDAGKTIDGRPSIRLDIALNGYRGNISLSSLYGSHSTETGPEITPGGVVSLLCPHCGSDLKGSWECPACEAAMVTLNLHGGGQVHVCSRHGCKSRLLDLAELLPAVPADTAR